MSTQEKSTTVSFRRSFDLGKVSVKIDCSPGIITVLQDENGKDLPAYESFFLGKKSSDRISIDCNGCPLELEHVRRVGFAPFNPEQSQIREFLAFHGYEDAKIAGLLEEYELEKVHYLPCSHLPQVPQRTVELLGALRAKESVIILRDPFMPFSGRLREHFAQLLLSEAQNSGHVIICTNLSFLPQVWSKDGVIQYLDVGRAAEEARSRYRWEQEQKQKEVEIAKRKKQESTIDSTSTKDDTSQEKVAHDPNTPEDFTLKSTYRGVYDWVFRPLSEISDFLRTYHLAVGLLGVTVIMITMGITLGPNVVKNWEKVEALSANSELTFGKLFSLVFSSEVSEADARKDDLDLPSDGLTVLKYLLENQIDLGSSDCHDSIEEQLRNESILLDLDYQAEDPDTAGL